MPIEVKKPAIRCCQRIGEAEDAIRCRSVVGIAEHRPGARAWAASAACWANIGNSRRRLDQSGVNETG